jgi:hypothetical protein
MGFGCGGKGTGTTGAGVGGAVSSIGGGGTGAGGGAGVTTGGAAGTGANSIIAIGGAPAGSDAVSCQQVSTSQRPTPCNARMAAKDTPQRRDPETVLSIPQSDTAIAMVTRCLY